MTMETRDYIVRFLTPAFLGDAQQNGRWRTPPFKHLLREWWRVAWVAAGNDPADWQRMREIEGKLFGHAWLDPRKGEDQVNARRSRVLVRLKPWTDGRLKFMPKTKAAGWGQAVVSHLYLGYGPVKSATELKMSHPIDASEQAELRLAFPAAGEVEGARYLPETLALMHRFGTVGGRSRNGWGSFELQAHESEPAPMLIDVAPYLCDWDECLAEEWPHAIGSDGRPLIWKTRGRSEWKSVIEDLAQIRKQVNGSARNRSERQILNQPVAGKGARMPSNLRFKVRRDESGKFYGLIFHMPHTPPPMARENRRRVREVWERVHALLDKHLQRGVP